MKITFFGACGEVTGSNFLVEAEEKKILFDCGLFQGNKDAETKNYSAFSYNPSEIDFVIVCHAHLDHVGRLPKLVREGFGGRIYATAPTCELARLVLEDNEKLMSEEAQHDKHEPLYLQEDVEHTIELFESIPYDKPMEISPGIRLTLKNAGHILGSAVAVLEAEGKRVATTSDLGNKPSELLDDPEYVTEADFLVCESTYGGRVHEDISRRHEKLAAVLNSTIAVDGVLIIPSLAIERTQELLHDVVDFCSTANCQKPTFFLDSPLAAKVTAVFKKYPEYMSKNLQEAHLDDFFGLDRLKITASVDDSKAIREMPNPKVIIAGSGMMNGGRILYHARDFLGDPKNTLLFVGYQAKGTLGRRLFDGVRDIKIFGEKVHVEAQVTSIGSYSAHADMPQLLNWTGKIEGLKKVFVTHGEIEQAQILCQNIASKFNIEAQIPEESKAYET